MTAAVLAPVALLGDADALAAALAHPAVHTSTGPWADVATRYAVDVLEGRIPASKWARLACLRHVRDLARQGAEGFPYRWNPEILEAPSTDPAGQRHPGKPFRPAERICGFAQLMPHIKGDWAARGMRIKLESWQTFVLASIFGWTRLEAWDEARADLGQRGRRRFRIADLFVPRKNAKSTIAAVIGNYMLTADGEHGAEVYSGATSEDQAYEVFRPARLMAAATPEFTKHYAVSVNISNLAVVATNSKFEPVIGKPGDGASPSCAIVDEYHEHKTAALYETMETGMGARAQPLLLIITTAGSDISGPCFSHQVELQKVLEGTVVNERRFGVIYGIDEGDDWTDPAVLRKANPNFGVSVDGEFLEAQQRDAITNPRKQNVFKTKHLNVWVQAASPWLNLYHVQKAGDIALKRADFADWVHIAGLDLASKVDIASRVDLFKGVRDGAERYVFFSRNYVPQSAIDKEENAHYREWVAKGWLTVTPGNMISLKTIEEDLVRDSEEQAPVTEIAFDAWGAREMAPSLQEQGFTVVDIPMQVRHLSEPMKLIQALFDDGRIQHDGNEATVWMLSNVEVLPDRNENIFPRKQRPENKIDAAVALIVAMARAMVAEVYENDGLLLVV